jgi:hypothetical protein
MGLMRRDTLGAGRLTRHISSVRVVALPSGRVLVGTGFCYLLLEDECGFLGHVRRRSCSAPAVAVELERLWSRPGSAGRLTELPVLRLGCSCDGAVMCQG